MHFLILKNLTVYKFSKWVQIQSGRLNEALHLLFQRKDNFVIFISVLCK